MLRIRPGDRSSALALIFAALAVLMFPIRWVMAAVLAAAVHEFGHLLAVWLCGGQVTDFHFRPGSAVMTAWDLSVGKQVICSLAGPVSGIALLTVARWFPAMAVCGLCQSLFNLLPMEPLDGGRILRNLASMLFEPKTAQKVIRYTQNAVITLFCFAAFYAAFWLKWGILPLVLLLVLILKKNSLQTEEETSTIALP